MQSFKLKRVGLGAGAPGGVGCSLVPGGRIEFNAKGFTTLYLDGTAAEAFERLVEKQIPPYGTDFVLCAEGEERPAPPVKTVASLNTQNIGATPRTKPAGEDAPGDWGTFTDALGLGFNPAGLSKAVKAKSVSTKKDGERVLYNLKDLARTKVREAGKKK